MYQILLRIIKRIPGVTHTYQKIESTCIWELNKIPFHNYSRSFCLVTRCTNPEHGIANPRGFGINTRFHVYCGHVVLAFGPCIQVNVYKIIIFSNMFTTVLNWALNTRANCYVSNQRLLLVGKWGQHDQLALPTYTEVFFVNKRSLFCSWEGNKKTM